MTIQTNAFHLSRRHAVVVFMAFACAYFLSSLIRAITATLSPTLTQEMALSSRDLGLLAGGYFLGFSLTQLPMGSWLDRFGPKKVNVAFLSMAVVGCVAFALAQSFAGLLLARMLCGAGLSACLMTALTGYRRWFDASVQLRANSWMLMTGSIGMLMSTLPVQWLVPIWGWRALFVALAVLIVVSMIFITWAVPAWSPSKAVSAAEAINRPNALDGSGVLDGSDGANGANGAAMGYSQVWRSRYFWRMAPLGFFCYGGLVAVQTLWAGPWMTAVGGWTPLQAATGLFGLNFAMLCIFWLWGFMTPGLVKRGVSADRLIAWVFPTSLAALAFLIVQADSLGSWTAAALTLFCVCSSVVSLAQPALGMAFPAALVGRALSAFNLVIFSGIFVVQWGIGLLIDVFKSSGMGVVGAFQAAMGVFLACSLAGYGYFLVAAASPPAQPAAHE